MYDPHKAKMIARLITDIKQLVHVIMQPTTPDLARINALGPMYEEKLRQLRLLKPDLHCKDFL